MITFDRICKDYGIALTGGVASGKSTVAELLRREGFVVIDADQLSRIIVAPGSEGLREVVSQFGPGILNDKGEMDRAKMRAIVFQDEGKRLALEGIIYQRLNGATRDALEREGLLKKPATWFYEASLIYERKRAADFHAVWVAWCPEALQISRLMQRDQSSREAALAILAAQMPAAEKKARADLVIDTDCSREELVQRVRQALPNAKEA